RLALGKIAGARRAALRFVGVAAAGRNDFTAIEERIGYRHGFLEQAARIVAQIDDEALQLVGADLAGEVADLALQALGGLLVEGGDADIADVIALDTGAHRAHADVVARERDFERLVLS